MQLVRTVAPAPILTVADAKRHLRVDHSDDDLIIDAYLQAAISMVDGPNGYLGRALGPQSWEMTLDASEFWTSASTRADARKIELPLAPLIAVDSVTYRNSGGTLTAYTTYEVVGEGSEGVAYMRPAYSTSWPSISESADALKVAFRCGYATTDGDSPATTIEAVPFAIKAAILLYVGALYEQRTPFVVGQTAYAIPWSAEQMLRPYRVHLSMA